MIITEFFKIIKCNYSYSIVVKCTNGFIQIAQNEDTNDCVREEILSNLAASILKYTMKPSPQQNTFICTKLVETYPI